MTNTTDIQTNHKLTVDFSHRLTSDADVVDSVGSMTERALGVLHLLSVQFTGGGDRISDHLMYGAIDSVIHEIEDIGATVLAYAKIEHTKE